MNLCDQERACDLCNTRENRTEHHYRVVGLDDRCYEQLECSRCNGKQKGDAKHSWGGWSQQGDEAIRICSQCGSGQTKKVD